jgi:hypothetical protein
LINEFGTLSNLIRQADTIEQKKRRESLMENAEKVRGGLHVTIDFISPLSHCSKELPLSFASSQGFTIP